MGQDEVVGDQVSDDWVDEWTADVPEPLRHWSGCVNQWGILLEGASADHNRRESVQVDEQDGDHFDDHRGPETPLVATLAHNHGEEGQAEQNKTATNYMYT